LLKVEDNISNDTTHTIDHLFKRQRLRQFVFDDQEPNAGQRAI
jgi:hypothetical protein